MTTTIHFVKVPAGRGKTRDYAFPRLSRGRAIYVAPTHQLLDAMGQMLNKSARNPLAQVLAWHQIDSRAPGMPVADQVAAYYSAGESEFDHVDRVVNDIRPLGITNECLRDLSPDLVRGRELVIDETPICVFVTSARAANWEGLLLAGRIAATDGAAVANGSDIHLAPGMAVTLTTKGKKELTNGGNRKDRSLDTATLGLLRFIDKAPTKIASKSGLHLYAVQELNPEIFRAAAKVTIMSASLTDGYFQEWQAARGFSAESEPHGLDVSALSCPNVEIFYALDIGRPGSIALLDNYKVAIARLVQQCFQPSRNGSLAGCLAATRLPSGNDREDSVIGIFNKAMDLKLPHYVARMTPGTLGINSYRRSDCVIYLAATQSSPPDLVAVKSFLGLGQVPLPTQRHYEHMYQGVMRSALREDNSASVKILVPTRKDAEVLSLRLGAVKPVRQCYPRIRIK